LDQENADPIACLAAGVPIGALLLLKATPKLQKIILSISGQSGPSKNVRFGLQTCISGDAFLLQMS
jgi:hypothetical protein